MTQPKIESVRIARVDARMTAVLDSTRALRYTAGPQPEDDLPGHVRAASAIRRHGARLLVVQDDVNALVLLHQGGRTEPILLPAGVHGRRVFEEPRGNKKLKLDLEACAAFPNGRLVAFGSGSSPHRETLVMLTSGGEVSQRQAHALYDGLRSHAAFAGSELNIEGALVVEDELLLFQRGNGAPRDGRAPVNAIGAIDLESFVRWLDGVGAVPSLTRIVPVDLGTLASVPLGFTDAALTADGRVAVVTCAEASENAIEDGPVAGCRFGWLEDNDLRMTDVLDTEGRQAETKIEGLEAHPGSSGAFDVVIDLDSPAVPATLARLSVRGG